MMFKFIQFFSFFCLLSCLQVTLNADYPSYENIYVNDWANLLDAQAESKITQKLKALKTDTQVEITLVTIGSMSDYANTKQSIESFALELFNQWGVGDAEKNNGVLVLVSRFDREMRIATGSGYDSTNKNSVAKSIIDNYFIPNFKQDNYQKGILAGMSRVVQEFNPNSSAAIGFRSSAKQSVNNTTFNAWHELKNSQFLIFLIIAGGIVLLNLFKSLAGRLFAGNLKSESYYIRPNYTIDAQPKHFKQVFPNEKKVYLKRYLIGLSVGLIALLFVAAFIGFNFVRVGFFALVSGLGISYAIESLLVHKRNKPKACPKCSYMMDRLSEVKDDKHLQLPERVEESLKAIDYDVWLCGNCQRTKKLPFPYWQSSIQNCKQCEYKTLEINVNTLVTATTSREGLEVVIEDCKYCDFHHEYERVIPMIPDDDDDYGGGGGSFGGGSSSGGGASGSW